ncbi:hypothetical protein KIN20_017664 [Parelaphostrongylus tenuis]|uniref:Uncharacterized protein n=1 Tax=Parelaphostrongylus tenuis TaxID=148309 RepID=A0AAD5MLV3_PARTN|nr:hypothetical protein KIN20_017664 [Parelaphostrongylus tenuis]
MDVRRVNSKNKTKENNSVFEERTNLDGGLLVIAHCLATATDGVDTGDAVHHALRRIELEQSSSPPPPPEPTNQAAMGVVASPHRCGRCPAVECSFKFRARPESGASRGQRSMLISLNRKLREHA